MGGTSDEWNRRWWEEDGDDDSWTTGASAPAAPSAPSAPCAQDNDRREEVAAASENSCSRESIGEISRFRGSGEGSEEGQEMVVLREDDGSRWDAEAESRVPLLGSSGPTSGVRERASAAAAAAAGGWWGRAAVSQASDRRVPDSEQSGGNRNMSDLLGSDGRGAGVGDGEGAEAREGEGSEGGMRRRRPWKYEERATGDVEFKEDLRSWAFSNGESLAKPQHPEAVSGTGAGSADEQADAGAGGNGGGSLAESRLGERWGDVELMAREVVAFASDREEGSAGDREGSAEAQGSGEKEGLDRPVERESSGTQGGGGCNGGEGEGVGESVVECVSGATGARPVSAYGNATFSSSGSSLNLRPNGGMKITGRPSTSKTFPIPIPAPATTSSSTSDSPYSSTSTSTTIASTPSYATRGAAASSALSSASAVAEATARASGLDELMELGAYDDLDLHSVMALSDLVRHAPSSASSASSSSALKPMGHAGIGQSASASAAGVYNRRVDRQIPRAAVVALQAAAAAKTSWPLNLQARSGLHFPPPPHLGTATNACDKCSLRFFSPLNHRRHIRVHRKMLRTDKVDLRGIRGDLALFLNKLGMPAVLDHISLQALSVEGIQLVDRLSSLVDNHRFPFVSPIAPPLPPYLKLGPDLVAVVLNKQLLSEDDLFAMLDAASENTFLHGGTSPAVHRFVFQPTATGNSSSTGGGVGGAGGGSSGRIKVMRLHDKDLVAALAFLLEQKLVDAYMAAREAAALKQQHLLVEEEAAAMHKRARLQQRRRKKRQRQKGGGKTADKVGQQGSRGDRGVGVTGSDETWRKDDDSEKEEEEEEEEEEEAEEEVEEDEEEREEEEEEEDEEEEEEEEVGEEDGREEEEGEEEEDEAKKEPQQLQQQVRQQRQQQQQQQQQGGGDSSSDGLSSESLDSPKGARVHPAPMPAADSADGVKGKEREREQQTGERREGAGAGSAVTEGTRGAARATQGRPEGSSVSAGFRATDPGRSLDLSNARGAPAGTGGAGEVTGSGAGSGSGSPAGVGSSGARMGGAGGRRGRGKGGQGGGGERGEQGRGRQQRGAGGGGGKREAVGPYVGMALDTSAAAGSAAAALENAAAARGALQGREAEVSGGETQQSCVSRVVSAPTPAPAPTPSSAYKAESGHSGRGSGDGRRERGGSGSAKERDAKAAPVAATVASAESAAVAAAAVPAVAIAVAAPVATAVAAPVATAVAAPVATAVAPVAAVAAAAVAPVAVAPVAVAPVAVAAAPSPVAVAAAPSPVAPSPVEAAPEAPVAEATAAATEASRKTAVEGSLRQLLQLDPPPTTSAAPNSAPAVGDAAASAKARVVVIGSMVVPLVGEATPSNAPSNAFTANGLQQQAMSHEQQQQEQHQQQKQTKVQQQQQQEDRAEVSLLAAASQTDPDAHLRAALLHALRLMNNRWDAAMSSPDTTILHHSMSSPVAPPAASTAFLDRLWSQLNRPPSPAAASSANHTGTSDATSSTCINLSSNINSDEPAVSSSVSCRDDGDNGTSRSTSSSQVVSGMELQRGANSVEGEGTAVGTLASVAGAAPGADAASAAVGSKAVANGTASMNGATDAGAVAAANLPAARAAATATASAAASASPADGALLSGGASDGIGKRVVAAVDGGAGGSAGGGGSVGGGSAAAAAAAAAAAVVGSQARSSSRRESRARGKKGGR